MLLFHCVLLLQYLVTDSTANSTSFQDGRFYDEQMSGPVRKLEWAIGVDYIYATTDLSVSLVLSQEKKNCYFNHCLVIWSAR